MMEPVVISVDSTQRFFGEEKQTVRVITDGTMSTEGDTVYLSYEETEITGMEGTTTTFAVCKDHVTLTRTGTVQSRMVFAKGKEDVSLYDMGFGALTIGVRTRRLMNRLGPDGGRIEISYGIEIEEEARGLNSFVIDVRRPGAGAAGNA